MKNTPQLSIKQFTRRFIAGYKKNVPFMVGKWWTHTSNFLKVRQPDSTIAEVEVFGMIKSDAIALRYKHYLMEQAHTLSIQNRKAPAPSNVPHLTDPDNIFKHAGCGGAIAYETINLDGDLSDSGVCHKCGAAGRFTQAPTESARDTSARFVVPHDAHTPLVPATGIVLSDTSFQMLREDVLSMLKYATATLNKMNKLETITINSVMMGFHCGDKKDEDYFGVDAVFLRDLCDVMDDGQVITFEVDNAGLGISLKYGNSTAQLKLCPQCKELDKKKGKYFIYSVFVPDFHGAAEKEAALDKWIAKALPRGKRLTDVRDSGRFALLNHYGDFASDGIRYHSNSALPHVDHTEEMPNIEDVRSALKACPVYAVWSVNQVKEVIKAVKQLSKAGKDRGILIRFADRTMTLFTDGDVRSEINIPWDKRMKAKIFRINPSYLLDALSGMTDGATLRIGIGAILLERVTREVGLSKMKFEI